MVRGGTCMGQSLRASEHKQSFGGAGNAIRLIYCDDCTM